MNSAVTKRLGHKPLEPLHGRTILIVEDDFFVGQALLSVLEVAGAIVVGPIGWLDEALAYLGGSENHLHGAVLDVNLHGQTSYPIADLLQQRGVPFIFATGYGSDSLDAHYLSCARVEKPFDHDALLAKLACIDSNC